MDWYVRCIKYGRWSVLFFVWKLLFFVFLLLLLLLLCLVSQPQVPILYFKCPLLFGAYVIFSCDLSLTAERWLCKYALFTSSCSKQAWKERGCSLKRSITTDPSWDIDREQNESHSLEMFVITQWVLEKNRGKIRGKLLMLIRHRRH